MIKDFNHHKNWAGPVDRIQMTKKIDDRKNDQMTQKAKSKRQIELF